MGKFYFITLLICLFSCSLPNKKDKEVAHTNGIPFRNPMPTGGGRKFEDFNSKRKEYLQQFFKQPIKTGITIAIKEKFRYLWEWGDDYDMEYYQYFTDSIYLHTFVVIRDGEPLSFFENFSGSDSICTSLYVSKFIFYQDTLLVKKDLFNNYSNNVPYNWTLFKITEVTLENNKKYFIISINEVPYNGDGVRPYRDIVIDTSLKTMRISKDFYWTE